MTAGFATTLRSSRATLNMNAIDAGAGPGLVKIYDGTRPATGGAVTTLLATVTCSDPCGTVTGGVLTFSAFTSGTAGNTGTATWARITDSTGAFVMDVSAGTVGTDLILAGTDVITAGNIVSIISGSITEGNA